jgi:hypothetical protein
MHLTGVGEETIIRFLKPKKREIAPFPTDEELDLKFNHWKNLSPMPKEMEDDLKLGLKKLRKFFKP